MSKIIATPDQQWTDEQVMALNDWQERDDVHPFTCPNRGDPPHELSDTLVAVNAGWICPRCNYRQNWAHDFMAHP